MTVYVIFADASDGYVTSTDTTYSTARAGGGTLTPDDSLDISRVGQRTGFEIAEAFMGFDTSVVTGAISSAVLAIYGSSNGSTTDFTIQARLYDWGTTVEDIDFLAGASLSGQTLLADFATAGFSTSGYNTFTSAGAFVSNVNAAGFTRLLLCSSRHVGNNTPTNDEFVIFRSANTFGTSQDPKLTITTLDTGGVLRPSIRNVLHNLIR